MTSTVLHTLLATRGYPAVSILCPMSRTYPGRRQNDIRLQNLLRSATMRLLEEFQEEEVRPLLKRLERLVGSIDPQSGPTAEGIAIYANPEWGTVVHLSLQVRERVVIDETFATRDIVMALGRRPRYRVLALSERVTRLYEGMGNTLTEISQGRFPLHVSTETGDRGRPPRADRGMGQTAAAAERRRQGLRAVDRAFADVNTADPLPVVIVGSGRALATFEQVSRGGARVIATVTLTEDSPPEQIAARVEPEVRAWIGSQEAKLIATLEEARWADRTVSGLQEAWTAARQGRIDSLLVEEGFHPPARLDPEGDELEAAEDADAPGVIDDAVDELIEEALAKGGRVAFVGDGALSGHARVAAILRY